MHVLYDATPSAIVARAVLGFVAAGAIALGALRMRSLTRSGALAAALVGTVGFAFGGALVAVAILLFFASGTVLSKIRNQTADCARANAAKQGERDSAQVLANGGIAVVCAIVGSIAAALGWRDPVRWMVAAVCALAAASGDTWSTEIGALLGGRARLITSMQCVVAGTSGAISLAGTLASPLGGAFVGLAGLVSEDRVGLVGWLLLAALAGLGGSAIDSFLGATAQGMWRCPRCERCIEVPQHEACDARASLVRGWAWLDNDGVNLIATICGAAIGYVLTPT